MHGSVGLGVYAIVTCLAIWAMAVSTVQAVNYGHASLGLRGWRLALYCPAVTAVVWAGLWIPMIIVTMLQRPRGRALIGIVRP